MAKPTSLYIDLEKRTPEMLDYGIKGTDVYLSQASPHTLGNVPGFEGLKYATPDYNKYSDLYSLYLNPFEETATAGNQPGYTTSPSDGGTGTGTTTGGTGTTTGGDPNWTGTTYTGPDFYDDQGNVINQDWTDVTDFSQSQQQMDQATDDYMKDYTDPYLDIDRDTQPVIGGQPGIGEGLDYDEHYGYTSLTQADLERAGAGIDDIYGTDYQGEEYTEPQSMLDTRNELEKDIDRVATEGAENVGYYKDPSYAGGLPGDVTQIGPGRLDLDTTFDPRQAAAYERAIAEQGFTQDYSAPRTLADLAEKDDTDMDFVSEADAANPKTLLDKLGLDKFNAAEAFVKTAINMAIGKPVTFFIDVLKGIIPPMDPRHKALNEFYKTDAIGRVAKGELMAGYNPVYGGFPGVSEPTYGLQKAYDERIGNTTDTLQRKYELTDAEIASIKAGKITDAIKNKAINATMTETYGKPTVSNLVQHLADLEAAKKAEELATRGARKLVSGDIKERDIYHDVALQDKKVGIEDEFSGLETALGIPDAGTAELEDVTQTGIQSISGGIDKTVPQDVLDEIAAEEAEAKAIADAAEKKEAERLAALNIDAGRDDGGGGRDDGGGWDGGGGDLDPMGGGWWAKGGLIRRPYAKGGIVSVMPTKFNKY